MRAVFSGDGSHAMLGVATELAVPLRQGHNLKTQRTPRAAAESRRENLRSTCNPACYRLSR